MSEPAHHTEQEHLPPEGIHQDELADRSDRFFTPSHVPLLAVLWAAGRKPDAYPNTVLFSRSSTHSRNHIFALQQMQLKFVR